MGETSLQVGLGQCPAGLVGIPRPEQEGTGLETPRWSIKRVEGLGLSPRTLGPAHCPLPFLLPRRLAFSVPEPCLSAWRVCPW